MPVQNAKHSVKKIKVTVTEERKYKPLFPELTQVSVNEE
jgi:hypothetical protein